MDRRWVFLDPLVVGAVAGSRLLVLLAAWVVETFVARNPRLTAGDAGPILQSLTAWDGWWYLGIVRDGYHAAPFAGGYQDFAFLPLYPMLVRVLSAPLPGFEGLVAVVLSNVLFVVAIALLVQLTMLRFSRELAIRSAVMLAIFPFSAVFSMAYPESLFLAVSLGAFIAAERRRPALAGILLAIATLTRLQGAVLVLPVAWLLWRSERPRLRWAALLLGPAAAVAAFAWVAWLTGDPSSYGAAQGAWGRLGLGGDPQGTLAQGLSGPVAFVHAVNFTVLLASVFLLVFVRRDRIPAPYVAVPVLYLGMVFLSGSIQSIGRLLAPAFPYDWILAGRRGWLGRVAWPVTSIALLFGLSVVMFAGWFVP